MQAAVADTGFLEQRFPPVIVRVRVQGSADRGGEDPVAVLPELTGDFPPALLLIRCSRSRSPERRGKANHPPAGVGLAVPGSLQISVIGREPARSEPSLIPAQTELDSGIRELLSLFDEAAAGEDGTNLTERLRALGPRTARTLLKLSDTVLTDDVGDSSTILDEDDP